MKVSEKEVKDICYYCIHVDLFSKPKMSCGQHAESIEGEEYGGRWPAVKTWKKSEKQTCLMITGLDKESIKKLSRNKSNNVIEKILKLKKEKGVWT